MIVRGLDVNGDWLYGKGRNDYKSGISAIAQDIQCRLNSFLGDCFFDTSAGVDWFNLLGGKNQLAVSLAVSATILNTENVVSLVELSISLNPVTRQLTIAYKVKVNVGTFVNLIAETTVTVGDAITTEDGSVLTDESGDPITTESGT